MWQPCGFKLGMLQSWFLGTIAETRQEEVLSQVITATVICNTYQCQFQLHCSLVLYRWAYEALLVGLALRLVPVTECDWCHTAAANSIFNAPTVTSREPHDQPEVTQRVPFCQLPRTPCCATATATAQRRTEQNRAEQSTTELRWLVWTQPLTWS